MSSMTCMETPFFYTFSVFSNMARRFSETGIINRDPGGWLSRLSIKAFALTASV